MRSNQGFLTVGHIKSTEVVWGEWQLFSDLSAAFAPKVVSLSDSRLLLAYRSYLVSGQMDTSDLTGFKLTKPYLLAKQLSETVELVPLSASRVVCLFGENVGGRAVVVLVSDAVNLLGKYRFGVAGGEPLRWEVGAATTINWVLTNMGGEFDNFSCDG
eukprot:Skav224165  [mRNA]  locus=scaffold2007:273426:278536:+ [translate_table: standard]